MKNTGKNKNDIARLLKDKNQGIKLDIGCGGSKQGKDWVGIDIQKMDGVDIVHDLETFPYPLPDNCCSVVLASHVIEHINPAKFGFVNFMNEIWRIMKPHGRFMISTPYAGSYGYFQDPTHVNPCNETTFTYFDPLHPNNFYRFYQPKPWMIIDMAWDQTGNLEVILEKRIEDK